MSPAPKKAPAKAPPRYEWTGGLVPPSIGALVLALSASLSLHVPVYVGLGALAAWQKAEFARTSKLPPSEVEFELGSDESDEASEELAELDDPAPDEAEAEDEEAEDEEAEQEEEPEPEPEERVARREPEPEPEPELVPATPRPPPPPQMSRLAVQQRSQDPSVEAPEDAEFIAEESSRVEEQTVAQLRNLQVDDTEQQAGMTQDPSESAEPGNSDEEEVLQMRDREGSDERQPTRQEVATRQPDPQPRPRAEPSVQPRPDPERRASPGAAGEGQRARGGGEERIVEVNDGFGTFRIAVSDRPAGRGEGDEGGEAVDGSGEGERGREAGRRGRRGRRGDRGRGRASGMRGPELRLSWRQFENLMGEEELREEREQFVRERQARLRGSNRQEEWRRFRAAIENYVPNVRPGNQTALNAAASPFATYLAEVHRRIHQEYALGFLRSLPGGALSPYADQSLMTKLEIILNRDGTVHRIGVVRTSGLLPFDHGAYAAVMHAQPYPEPPSSILSGDGRVYVHWGFYRNHRQCGTFNAEPFVLPHPPGSRPQTDDPFRDGLTPGGVIRPGTQPTEGASSPEGGDPGQREERPSELAPTPVPPGSSRLG